MTQKKKTALMVGIVLIAAVVLSLFLFQRPQSLAASMGSGFDPAEAETLEVILSPVDKLGFFQYNLTPGEAGYEDLLHQLEQHRYCRKLPFGAREGHAVTLDHIVTLNFFQNEKMYSLYMDGYEDLYLMGYSRFPDCVDFTVAGLNSQDSEAFQQKILDLLLEQAPEGSFVVPDNART